MELYDALALDDLVGCGLSLTHPTVLAIIFVVISILACATCRRRRGPPAGQQQVVSVADLQEVIVTALKEMGDQTSTSIEQVGLAMANTVDSLGQQMTSTVDTLGVRTTDLAATMVKATINVAAQHVTKGTTYWVTKTGKRLHPAPNERYDMTTLFVTEPVNTWLQEHAPEIISQA